MPGYPSKRRGVARVAAPWRPPTSTGRADTNADRASPQLMNWLMAMHLRTAREGRPQTLRIPVAKRATFMRLSISGYARPRSGNDAT